MVFISNINIPWCFGTSIHAGDKFYNDWPNNAAYVNFAHFPHGSYLLISIYKPSKINGTSQHWLEFSCGPYVRREWVLFNEQHHDFSCESFEICL